MGLNIKNETVERLAREVAAQTGESLSSATSMHLKRGSHGCAGTRISHSRKRRVREILARSGPTPTGLTSDHSDLYDELGLPK